MTVATHTPTLRMLRPEPDRLTVQFAGDWVLAEGVPPAGELLAILEGGGVTTVTCVAPDLGRWDSVLVACVARLGQEARRRDIAMDLTALPTGVRRLVDLACAVPARPQPDRPRRAGFLSRVSGVVTAASADTADRLGFLGELVRAAGQMVRGRARFRMRDLWSNVYGCGIGALPIVALISFLVGTILAFIGAVQLEQFGAQIYVADLVGLAMSREMAPMMTAIIMAGRTGAAFAARMGTMIVNDEVDALRTLGFDPMEFLVLPRVVALGAMMPLLCAYSNAIGIAGGMLVAVSMLDVTVEQYWSATCVAVDITDFGIGLIKSAVFGVLIALAGCLDGLRCGRSAAAVGAATTAAVVHAIVAIIVGDAIFAVLTNAFHL